MRARARCVPWMLGFLVAACGVKGPPRPALPPTPNPRELSCGEAARTLLKRVPTLTVEGKLNRALRVIADVSSRCPDAEPLTRRDRFILLTTLGRTNEARDLAALLERKDASELSVAQRIEQSDALAQRLPWELVELSDGLAASGQATGARRIRDQAMSIAELIAGQPMRPALQLVPEKGTHVAVSDDGQTVALASGDYVALLETGAWRKFADIYIGDRVSAVAFGHRNDLLAVSARGRLEYWHVSARVSRAPVARKAVCSLPSNADGIVFSPGDKLAALWGYIEETGWFRVVRSDDCATLLAETDLEGRLSAAFSPDETLVSLSEYDCYRTWSLPDGSLLRKRSFPKRGVDFPFNTAVSYDMRWLAAGYGPPCGPDVVDPGTAHTVVFDSEGGRPVWERRDRGWHCATPGFTPSGRYALLLCGLCYESSGPAVVLHASDGSLVHPLEPSGKPRTIELGDYDISSADTVVSLIKGRLQTINLESGEGKLAREIFLPKETATLVNDFYLTFDVLWGNHVSFPWVPSEPRPTSSAMEKAPWKHYIGGRLAGSVDCERRKDRIVELVSKFGLPNAVTEVRMWCSPDASTATLVDGTNNVIRVWDLQTLRQREVPSPVAGASWVRAIVLPNKTLVGQLLPADEYRPPSFVSAQAEGTADDSDSSQASYIVSIRLQDLRLLKRGPRCSHPVGSPALPGTGSRGLLFCRKKPATLVLDPDDLTELARFWVNQDATQWVAMTPDGYVEVFPRDRAHGSLGCNAGTITLPFDVCRERYEVPGLWQRILRGDNSFRSP